jgi:signal transduction histidine kinase
MSRLPRFRDLPLFAKQLMPFLALTVFLGGFGVTLVVRDLSARAQTTVDGELTRRALDARALLRDRELYLLESVNLAANLQGMPDAIRARNDVAIARLLRSVLALKTDVHLVAAADRDGAGLVEFVRAAPSAPADRSQGTPWAQNGFVAAALSDPSGHKSLGFVPVAGRRMLAIAAPVCSAPEPCRAVGTAIVGIGVDALAADALGTTEGGRTDVGVALFDANGSPVATAGKFPATVSIAKTPHGRPSRSTGMIAGEEYATLASPLEIGGVRSGTLAVSVPTAPAFASVRGARGRLSIVLIVALAGVVALGAMITRLLLRQIRPLVQTNRALGGGDLSARARVLGNDELGELARGVNEMAEQLQASYGTLELQVAQRTEEIRRLLQERTEFFASISHELRTPLAVIQAKAKMLEDPTFEKSRAWTADTGRTIRSTTSELLAVVNDILELARVESGHMRIDLEPVDLTKVLSDLRPMITGLAKAGGLQAGINLSRNLPPVRADRVRLREVIVNLVDNAVKYTPPGGRVSVGAEASNGAVHVTVRDTGIGIPAEAAELVFEPFYRVNGASTQAGQASTGLGLALAKRLVEAQGGRIWFTCDPETGTAFTFTLPRAEQDA